MERAARLALLLLSIAVPAGTERLPFRVFTSADGLAGDAVRALLRDSRGFLWIATSSGPSRFDGQAFRTYDTAEGLPSSWPSRRRTGRTSASSTSAKGPESTGAHRPASGASSSSGWPPATTGSWSGPGPPTGP